uniref:Transporter n=1 Tax=Eiseniibacteriota bacterium TaxID=2212470 RepID=A0A832I822_UNCEI
MLSRVVEFLAPQPLILLFLVLALGFALGRVRVRGFAFGVAAVLFVGLAFGALDPRLQVPEVVQRLGLVLFVYTVGLSTGPGFVAALRRGGVRDAAFAAVTLALGAGVALLAHAAFGFGPALTAGLYCGALTNTPALAAVTERLRAAGAAESLAAEPVVAYAISYPMGVLAALVALVVARRTLFRGVPPARREPLEVVVLRVTRPEACALPLGALARAAGWRARFGRVLRAGRVDVVRPREPLRPGDVVSAVAPASEVAALVEALGERCAERIDLDRRTLDHRRVFVSNPAVVEQRIRDLVGLDRLGARITRVRRGDADVLPAGDTVLQPGDRVRVLAPRERMDEVTRFFGDSYRALAEVDVLTFGLGAALGLALGLVPLPLPGGGAFQLGLAGGPLVVGLALGALGRSGPVVWVMPYNAGLTLRQIGLVLFLAGVGTRSGWVFARTFGEAGGLALFGAGAALTFAVAMLTLWAGHAILRVPPGVLAGMLSGVFTQPAVLAFAKEGSDDDGVDVGYVTVYPVTTVAKILFAQALLGLAG